MYNEHPSFLRGASVLVTGATGQLGQRLISMLSPAKKGFSQNPKIIALCRNEKKGRILFSDTREVQIVVGDILDPTILKKLPPTDYVLHTAGPVGPTVFSKDPISVLEANATGTLNLLKLACAHGCKGFVFASSHEVYGALGGEDSGVVTLAETDAGALDPMQARACYSQGKRAAETALACYSAQHGLRTMSARLSRFYGPEMNMDSGLFICDFIRQAQAGGPVRVKGDAALLRPLCHTEDAARAMLAILDGGRAGEAYNVQAPEPLTLGSVARAVAGTYGVEVVFDRPETLGLLPHGQMLGTHKLEALGWNAEWFFAAGLKSILA